jgi:hypothetical protein
LTEQSFEPQTAPGKASVCCTFDTGRSRGVLATAPDDRKVPESVSRRRSNDRQQPLHSRHSWQRRAAAFAVGAGVRETAPRNPCRFVLAPPFA